MERCIPFFAGSKGQRTSRPDGKSRKRDPRESTTRSRQPACPCWGSWRPNGRGLLDQSNNFRQKTERRLDVMDERTTRYIGELEHELKKLPARDRDDALREI